MIVGIDLGTTYSLVAAMRDGAPVVLPNVVGEVLTPSAVSVDADGEIIVGAAARARATTHPDRTALSFKRDMGTRKKLSLGPHELSPPELSALVLRSLKQDAEAVLGATVDEAVVTVPAYFGDAQRQATRDAGEIAGLRVDRIINEPTAAALAYGLQNRSRDLRAVVLDLGGGTFDVSVLEIVDGVVEIHASAGDTRLGGDDFDDALAKALLQRIAARHGIEPKLGRASAARLRRAAELLKMRLGRADEARVALHALEVGKETLDVELDVTRAEAESAWRHCLDRLDGPVHRALLEAKVEPRAIDEVLLVGGATRMPAVVERATRMFGRQPRTDLPPDEAVALGAAVQAALKSRDASVGDMVVADVAPFSLGIAQAAYVGANIVRGMFAPLITRGTTIPASALRRFSTAEEFQGLLRIEVFQGEHSVCASNTRLGDVVVNVPKRRAGEEKVDVRFTYDLNGILEVDTTVVSSGKKTTLVFEQGEGRMSRLEVVEARIRMQALKLRPRAMLVNLVALERGEALHVELRGERRAALAAHLGALRAALDADDLGDVDVARAQLLALLEVLRSEWDLV